jgi:hypothetical protein
MFSLNYYSFIIIISDTQVLNKSLYDSSYFYYLSYILNQNQSGEQPSFKQFIFEYY